MTRPMIDLYLHTVRPATFVEQVTSMNQNRKRSAQQNYLLCKSAIARRRAELRKRQALEEDTSQLERMISRLEKSMQAHLRIVEQAEE